MKIEIDLVRGGGYINSIHIKWCKLTPTIWVWHRTDGPAALWYNLETNNTEMAWALNNLVKFSKIKGGL